MASNLQLPLTVVAQTGSGLLYLPYSQGPDQVIWKNGSGATRSNLTYNRVKPKPTPTFPGVERLELKTTQFFTVNDIEYQSVFGLTASIPTVMSSTLRNDQCAQLIFLAHDTLWTNAAISNLFPT